MDNTKDEARRLERDVSGDQGLSLGNRTYQQALGFSVGAFAILNLDTRGPEVQ